MGPKFTNKKWTRWCFFLVMILQLEENGRSLEMLFVNGLMGVLELVFQNKTDEDISPPLR